MNNQERLYHLKSHIEELTAQNSPDNQDQIIDSQSEIMRLEAVIHSEAIQSQLTSQSPPLANPGE
jgi:hypothetical protein